MQNLCSIYHLLSSFDAFPVPIILPQDVLKDSIVQSTKLNQVCCTPLSSSAFYLTGEREVRMQGCFYRYLSWWRAFIILWQSGYLFLLNIANASRECLPSLPRRKIILSSEILRSSTLVPFFPLFHRFEFAQSTKIPAQN